MSAAWIGLIGVVVGALLTGVWTLLVHNSGQVENQRDALLARLDRLMEVIARVEKGVQRYAAAATLYKGESRGAGETRYLEEAGDATGDIAVNVFVALTLAKEVDAEGELSAAVTRYCDAAEAIPKARHPERNEVSPEHDEFLEARKCLLDELGPRVAAVRNAAIPLRARLVGRFRP